VAKSKEVIHMRTSERRAAKRCWQRWWWSYREGLTAKEPSMALWFGSGIHEALAHYYNRKGYKRNLDFVEVWEKWCDEGDPDSLLYLPVSEMGDDWVEARGLGISMLREYHKRYEGDKDWDFIQPEMPFQVRIKLDDGSEIEYDGTLDGVYRKKSTRKIELLENKTAKNISVRHLSLDDQAGGYWGVAATILRHKGILGGRQNIEGINYNFLRKAMPDDRPRDADGYATNKPTKVNYAASKELQSALGLSEVRLGMKSATWLQQAAEEAGIIVLGEVSKVQPPPLFERHFIKRTPRERKSQIQKIKDEALHIKAMREGLLPVTKNPTMDCSWDCAFFQMCELHDQGVGWEDFRDSVFVVTDPYADHRKPA
jgi:hypothetical protein